MLNQPKKLSNNNNKNNNNKSNNIKDNVYGDGKAPTRLLSSTPTTAIHTAQNLIFI